MLKASIAAARERDAFRLAYRHPDSLDSGFAWLSLKAQGWPRDMQDVFNKWVGCMTGGACESMEGCVSAARASCAAGCFLWLACSVVVQHVQRARNITHETHTLNVQGVAQGGWRTLQIPRCSQALTCSSGWCAHSDCLRTLCLTCNRHGLRARRALLHNPSPQICALRCSWCVDAAGSCATFCVPVVPSISHPVNRMHPFDPGVCPWLCDLPLSDELKEAASRHIK